MAKITFSAVVGQARGSQGATTFSRNRGGAYTRSRVAPLNPRTARQTEIRNRMSAVAAAWRALTDAQRAAWTALGVNMTRTDSLGTSYQLTGSQAYAANNLVRNQLGQASVTAAPALDAAPDVTAGASTASGATGAVIANWTGNGTATQKIAVYATAPFSAGKSFVKDSQYKFMGYVAGNLLTLTITAAYAAAFGAPGIANIGQKIGIKLVPVSTNYFEGTSVHQLVTISNAE